jgi:hypothetical protein
MFLAPTERRGYLVAISVLAVQVKPGLLSGQFKHGGAGGQLVQRSAFSVQ